jgi:mono/diheme cytochrome c family protein
VTAQVKKLTEGKALLFALIVSGVSLLATLSASFIFRTPSRLEQSKVAKSGNVSGETALQGRRLFVKHCVECHGYDARGDEGSDLHNIRAGDALIRQVITSGIKGEMPAYGRVLNEADVRALTSYLRTLRN